MYKEFWCDGGQTNRGRKDISPAAFLLFSPPLSPPGHRHADKQDYDYRYFFPPHFIR